MSFLESFRSKGKGKRGRFRRGKQGAQFPVKRSINFMTAGVKPLRITDTIPYILVSFLAVILVGKFAIVDRFQRVYEEQEKVAELQQSLALAYRTLDRYEDLSELYAHYTYSGMTATELSLASRVEVMNLIERYITPSAEVTSWRVSGNSLTVTISSSTLQAVNLMTQQVENDPLVSFCSVTTAATVSDNDRIRTEEYVNAQMIIYLRDATTMDSQFVSSSGSQGENVVGKNISGIAMDFSSSVPGDPTGRIRLARTYADILIEEYAVCYWKTYCTDYDEIHYVLNDTRHTTSKISYVLGKLEVDVYERTEGEEENAQSLPGGILLAQYLVNMETGEIEKL